MTEQTYQAPSNGGGSASGLSSVTAPVCRSNPIQPASLFLVGLICLASLGQCVYFALSKSITIDETFYMSCALQSVQDGRLDPRLVQNGVAPLGAMLSNLPIAIAVGGRDRTDPWVGRPEDVEWIFAARILHAVLVLVPLVILIFVWLACRQGSLAGVIGVVLIGFSPTIIAHAAISTTDAAFALTALLALLALAQYRRAPSPRSAFVAVAAFSACIATKYSGVFLVPVACWGLYADALRGTDDNKAVLLRHLHSLVHVGKQLAPLGIGVFAGVWILHGLQLVGLPGRELSSTPWLLRPAPIVGVVYQLRHNQAGHHAYLAGAFSLTGWWYYFPLALALKSTLVELLLLIVGLPLALWRSMRLSADRDLGLQTLAIATLVLMFLAMRAKVNIGHRYLLPLYPFVVLICMACLWPRVERLKRSARTAALAAVALVQVAASVSAAPHYLAYFSPLVGGGVNGGQYLIDSNLDWGQDLVLLADELKALGRNRVILEYFGSAEPSGYGIHSSSLAEVVATKSWSQHDAVAVSETFLRGGYSYGRDPYRRLREIKPIGRAGYSIRIYDTKDPAVRSAMAFAYHAGVPKR